MLKIQGKIWLECNSKCVLGGGRAELLRGIKRYGSLTKVAQSMNMAYSHAWSEINEISDAIGGEVIVTIRGGKQGGSSHLTPLGEQLLDLFEKEKASLELYLSQRNQSTTQIHS